MANPNHRPASAGTLVRARPARAVILTTGLLLRLRGIRRSDRLPG